MRSPKRVQQLRQGQALKQLFAMLVGTADGALVLDPAGNVAFWNLAAERLIGFRAHEVLGRPCHEVIDGRTVSGSPICAVPCAIASQVVCGEAVENFDMRISTKAGKTALVNVSSLSVPTCRKGRFAVAHLFRDITRHQRAGLLADKLDTALNGDGPSAPHVLPSNRPVGEPPELSSSLPLSKREREVLRLLAAGEATRIIADRLGISPATVRNHVQHIMQKLGAHSRLQALVVAFRLGLRGF